MTQTSVQLGRILRDLRHIAGVTQEELASHSGISVRTIVEIERGHTKQPRASTVRKLAVALELDEFTMRQLFVMAAHGTLTMAGTPQAEEPAWDAAPGSLTDRFHG
jgi:transcriptional regulator with XRE-family HTH domain